MHVTYRPETCTNCTPGLDYYQAISESDVLRGVSEGFRDNESLSRRLLAVYDAAGMDRGRCGSTPQFSRDLQG